MKKIFNFMSGMIFGSLVGAAVAILLAPESGDEFRSDIQSRYIEIKDEVQSAAATRRTELEKQLETLRKPKTPEK